MQIEESLRGQLIVSCQAWPGDPLDDAETIRRISMAALCGGAQGLRIDNPKNIRTIRAHTQTPIIGLYKHYFGHNIRITPTFAAARELAEAGASIIALDCTNRRPLAGEDWKTILRRIRTELNLPVMADISTEDEAIAAQEAGADYAGTTLAGYTEHTAKLQETDWALIERLSSRLRIPVIAEGRIATPEAARRALELGAFAVVVGTAITRPRAIVSEYVRHMQSFQSNQYVIGVDIGGTSVKAGLVNRSGEILVAKQVPTQAKEGRQTIVTSAELATQQVLDSPECQAVTVGAIGVASAGSIQASDGSVFAATENLPGWTGFRLGEHFRDKFNLPVQVENDAHAAALAELIFGVGRTTDNFVVLTIGTGLWSGIVLGRQLLRGINGFGGGVGHHSLKVDGIPCNCGRRGCMEAYVSATALVREYREIGGPQTDSAKAIFTRAESGDALARNAIDTMTSYLVDGLANIWSFVDPTTVVLAGGLVQDHPHWIDQIRAAVYQRLPFAALRQPQVVVSRADVYAGMQGAAAAVFAASKLNADFPA